MAIITAQKINFKSFDGATDYFLNDRASLKAKWSIAPYYFLKVDSVDGLYGSDISSESHPIEQATGEISGDSFRRGKGLSINGTIEGRNLAALEAGRLQLQQIFWDTRTRKLIWNIDTTPVYLKCHVVNDLSVIDTITSWDPKWTWTVGLRADDPRTRKVSDDSVYPTWQT